MSAPQIQLQFRDILAEAEQLLTDAALRIEDLRNRPGDQEAVQEAMALLRVLRDSQEPLVRLHKLATSVRNEAIAAVYGARPRVKIERIANAAGVNTSFVTRVAHRLGMPRRTNRPSRAGQEST